MGSKEGPKTGGEADFAFENTLDALIVIPPGDGPEFADDGPDAAEPDAPSEPDWDREPDGIGENSAAEAGELASSAARDDASGPDVAESPAPSLEDAHASLDASPSSEAGGGGDLSTPEPGDLSDAGDRSQLNDAAREKARQLAATRGAARDSLSR